MKLQSVTYGWLDDESSLRSAVCLLCGFVIFCNQKVWLSLDFSFCLRLALVTKPFEPGLICRLSVSELLGVRALLLFSLLFVWNQLLTSTGFSEFSLSLFCAHPLWIGILINLMLLSFLWLFIVNSIDNFGIKNNSKCIKSTVPHIDLTSRVGIRKNACKIIADVMHVFW